MDTALITFLLELAIKFSGLPSMAVEQLPSFERVSRAEMHHTVCPESQADHGCAGIMAVFDTERNRILYLDTLDLEKPADNSFLLHEIVHALQYRQHGTAIYADCAALLATEQQAYAAQNAYLRREGVFMRVGEVLRYTTCAPPAGTVAAHANDTRGSARVSVAGSLTQAAGP
ncbi:MAG: hypothetical protein JNJ60_18515 [Rhodocyclaceae bacterium]|nr:hypothetical protein [Rhodocyclaceae bacterium]